LVFQRRHDTHMILSGFSLSLLYHHFKDGYPPNNSQPYH